MGASSSFPCASSKSFIQINNNQHMYRHMLQVPFVEIRHCQDATGLCQPLIRRQRNCLSGLNKLVSGTWTAKNTTTKSFIPIEIREGCALKCTSKQALLPKERKYDRNNTSAFVEAIRVRK